MSSLTLLFEGVAAINPTIRIKLSTRPLNPRINFSNSINPSNLYCIIRVLVSSNAMRALDLSRWPIRTLETVNPTLTLNLKVLMFHSIICHNRINTWFNSENRISDDDRWWKRPQRSYIRVNTEIVNSKLNIFLAKLIS